MSKIKLLNGDCLELLGTLEDKSIDLVLTDPPYNIAKAKWDKWKTQEEYVEWCGKWFLECQRVLKDNGSMYFFHNDMVQIAQLMEWLRKNTAFVFNSFIIWDKGDVWAKSWKNPSEKSKLRSWFNTSEYCLYYTFDNEYFYRCIEPSQTYFKELIYDNGGSVSKFNDFYCNYSGKTGVFRGHFFGKSQPSFFTEEQYKALVEYIKELNPNAEIKEYEDLRKEFESLRYTHNLDKEHNNMWRYEEENNCDYCLYYTFQEEKEYMGANKEIFKPYIDYINYELNKNNLKWNSPEIVDAYVNSGIAKNIASAKVISKHNFDTEYSQFRVISEANYSLLKPILKFEKEYEELRKEFEELRYTHNLDQNHNNIWISTEKRNNGKLHPTQKPTDILERIIKTSSNEGDVVLDCFMGSGSTGIAAVNLNRDFIGIERDEQYFEIAKERIEEALQDKVGGENVKSYM